MRNRGIIGLIAGLALLGTTLMTPGVAEAAEKRVGVGVHYWRALDELRRDDVRIDRDGSSFIASLQIVPRGMFSLELDVEYFDRGFAGSESAVWSPQAFLLIGHGLYAGVGIGSSYSSGFEDGDFSDPFYMARVGINMELLPRLFLDLNANYRANAFKELDEASTGTITLGAVGRIAFGSR